MDEIWDMTDDMGVDWKDVEEEGRRKGKTTDHSQRFGKRKWKNLHEQKRSLATAPWELRC